MPQLTHLDVTRCSLLTDVTFSYLSFSSSLSHHLRILIIDSCENLTSRSLLAITTYCGNTLTHLSCNDCDEFNDQGMISLNQCTQLISLSANAIHIHDQALSALAHCKQLQSLSLKSCTEISPIAMNYLIPCIALTQLDFTSLSRLDDSGIHTLTSSCHYLIEVNLSKCPLLTSTSLEYISDGWPLLSSLNLSWCTAITDVGFSYLQSLPLTRICVSRCHRLTDSALLALSKLPSLTSLDLSSMNHITDAGIGHLTYSCKGLTLVDVRGCYKISKAAVRRFPSHCVVKM